MNPFLDSLGNFALKNIDLPPGTGSGCFQSSQDAGRYTASATFSTTSTKTEKKHGRLEKNLEFELEQVWKNRENRIKTTAASQLTTTVRKLAFIRIH